MASLIRVGIAGTGAYVPERAVPNSYFEDFLDTSDEWIVQRTGIRERRWAADDEATSDMCVEAAKSAMEAAGVTSEELDLIVLGTLTPDAPLPATACLIQEQLGAVNAAAFDCNSACTGFVTALQIGESFLSTGKARRALVLGAETLSRFVDLQERDSCILFGDGAGAAILMPHDECGQGEILRTSLGADGTGNDFIHIPGGGARLPTSQMSLDERKHYIRMRGREVFRFAVSHMSELIREMLEGRNLDELGVIVPHQVNRRVINAALDRLGMTDEKVVINIQHYGNTSAATVPIALDEAVREGRVEKGKLVVLVAFGAGLTWGGALLRW
jgi:3-oxoacyl-[acyl-carrier-protein] synthase-3